MPAPPCTAPQCSNPARDGFLCDQCFATLRRDLAAVPELLQDLEITISRQDRIGDDTNGRRSAEIPLPLRLTAMEARRDLSATLAYWVQQLAPPAQLPGPADPPDIFASWLSEHLAAVAVDKRAGDCADEIGYAVITARRAIDKPLQPAYAGPCQHCTTDLYAKPTAPTVTCEGCTRTYDVADRRKWLLEHVHDQLLTATELSRALPNLIGTELTSAMVRGYAHRGRLAARPPHPADPRQDPRYRCGDVIALVVDAQRTKARQGA